MELKQIAVIVMSLILILDLTFVQAIEVSAKTTVLPSNNYADSQFMEMNSNAKNGLLI